MTLPTKMLSTPPLSLGFLELRALADAFCLPKLMAELALIKPLNVGHGRQVCVLPGFGADDRAMFPMRYFLGRHGFKPFGWGLGVNKAGLNLLHSVADISWRFQSSAPNNGETGVPYLCELMKDRIQAHSKSVGTPVSLVGWSLGGTIAREVARDLPNEVDQVITLGSPLIGGPKYTRAAPVLSKKGLNLDWIEAEVEHRSKRAFSQKMSAIVSQTDGIVDWSASKELNDTSTRYITTDTSHLGMAINRQVMNIVLEELCREVN